MTLSERCMTEMRGPTVEEVRALEARSATAMRLLTRWIEVADGVDLGLAAETSEFIDSIAENNSTAAGSPRPALLPLHIAANSRPICGADGRCADGGETITCEKCLALVDGKPERTFEVGPGFVAAVACPSCGHTRCSSSCQCSCGTGRAWREVSGLRQGLAAAVARAEAAERREAAMREALEHLRQTAKAVPDATLYPFLSQIEAALRSDGVRNFVPRADLAGANETLRRDREMNADALRAARAELEKAQQEITSRQAGINIVLAEKESLRAELEKVKAGAYEARISTPEFRSGVELEKARLESAALRKALEEIREIYANRHNISSYNPSAYDKIAERALRAAPESQENK